jgi:hypothetical protein
MHDVQLRANLAASTIDRGEHRRPSQLGLRRLAVWVSLLASLTVGLGARAATIDDLYLYEVPVTDEQASSREAALALAFKGVVARLIGKRANEIPVNLANEARRATEYVQQFRYVSLSARRSTATGARTRQALSVRFDPSAMERLIVDAGLPIWGRTRPSVLVWAALDDGRARAFASSEADQGITAAVRAVARQRGIPLLAPLLDVQDMAQLKLANLWGGFEAPLLAASRRYQADTIVALRVLPEGGRWTSRWTFVGGGMTDSWQASGNTPANAAAAGANVLADKVSSAFAPQASDSDTTIVIRVRGVSSLTDYARATDYLTKLDSVREFGIRSVEADMVEYQIAVFGGLAQFDRVVTLGNVLERAPGSVSVAASAGASSFPVYVLRR